MTMTTVRTHCDDCGDVTLDVDDLEVRLCDDTSEVSYCFRCPECGVATAKSTNGRIVEMLVSNGVQLIVWRMPDEPRPDGPPFTPNDILDFYILLQGDRWMEAL